MLYEDLREFMELLEKRGELKKVKKAVDRKLELALVAKKALDMDGPALLFENVKGFDIPVVTGLHNPKERCYLGFDADFKNFSDKAAKALKEPMPCKTVKSGPCKEVILTGNKVDVRKFPILWCNEKDMGYYMTATNVIVKDPDTDKRNNSIHRVLIMDKNKLSSWVNIFHLWEIIKKYWDRGKPCPVAIVIGTDPAVFQSAAIKMPYEIDELEFASAMRGKPVEMVGCETIDLDVPATAEFVIEGEFPPHVRVKEGPFSEFTGHYGSMRASPIIDVKAVTHRKDMIYQSIISGFPIDDQQALCAVSHEVQLFGIISKILPKDRIKGIWCTVPSCGFNSVISIDKLNPGEGRLVATAAMSFYGCRNVTIVDKDVDPSNPVEVEWAQTWRARAEDIFMVESTGAPLDPMARHDCVSSKVAIDATLPVGGDKYGKEDMLIELGPARFPTEKIDLADYISED